MSTRERRVGQTDLFAAGDEREAADAATNAGSGRDAASVAPRVGAAPVAPEHARIAGSLAPSIRLGTSSWSFPGWAGLVYDSAYSTTQLSRHGLAAYARHPLLRAVGVDRTFYAPMRAEEFAVYAEAVPSDFRFLVKANADITSPRSRGAASRTASSALRFLDAAYATVAAVEPAVTGLGDRLGVLLFQFPPMSMRPSQVEAFPEQLRQFLAALPAGVPYAVEIRNAALLTPAYRDALASAGTGHCYSVHPSLPSVSQQRALMREAESASAPAVIRWMLRPTEQYESARDAYAPFDQLVAPDLEQRLALSALIAELALSGREPLVIVNNKAEGSSPRSIVELARLLARND